MNSVIKHNKGKGNFEELVRKIYIKYVYKGNPSTNEIEIFNSNFVELINQVKMEADIQELEELLQDKYNKREITDKEYNYLLNLLKEKRNEIL